MLNTGEKVASECGEKVTSELEEKATSDFKAFLAEKKTRIESFLEKILHVETTLNRSQPLIEAMRYAVFNGGKRLRPILVYATGEALGVPLSWLDAAAASVELIHCYSLVHDDLPAMDNDDLRRGKPTCHKAFDEATAILAGDALQTLAFEILADLKLNELTASTILSVSKLLPTRNVLPTANTLTASNTLSVSKILPTASILGSSLQLEMISLLAKSAGAIGMIGGQAADMAANNHYDLQALINIHQGKTGALIRASVMMAFIAAKALKMSVSDTDIFFEHSEESQVSTSVSDTKRNIPVDLMNIKIALEGYAENIGLSFQVQDDILDVIGEQKMLGKNIGQDAKLHKATFPAILGLNEAKAYAHTLQQKAIDSLKDISLQDNGLRLKQLSEYFINRLQ